jgi:signal transduction histidine kinase
MIPAALAVLVVTLAILQYRWLDQVSDAERERMKTTLMQRADAFARDFDREVLHLYLALQTASAAVAERDWTPFARRYDIWRESAEYPQLVKGLYFVERDGDQTPLRQYRAESKTFEPVEWPADLAAVRDRVTQRAEESSSTVGGQLRTVIMFREPVVPSIPALVISLPMVRSLLKDAPPTQTSISLTPQYLIAHLDRAYIESALLPALASRHFPERGGADYRFAVLDTAASPTTIYSHGLVKGASLDPAKADAVVPFFSLRLDLTNQGTARAMLMHGSAAGFDVIAAPPPPPAPVPGWIEATTVTTRETPPRPKQVTPTPPGPGQRAKGTFSIVLGQRNSQVSEYRVAGFGAPAWQFVVQHSAGSLDAAVAQARRRNLYLSFGILAVLASGVGLVVLNARRSERLAAQQMEFVATVSHELRTPLAVIRSAAQNLSAGVVHEAAQARRYGDLIEQEGRRLTDMVEQVLAYAGVSDARGLVSARPADLGAMVADVLAAAEPLVRAAGFEQAVDIAPNLPPVVVDEAALRRAIDNLVTNAIKHGADGRWLGVSVRRTPGPKQTDEIQIAVRDRGPGIDAQDLPHIFEPFYRGRPALDRQVQGNGLGLSLVKRIATAHGGRVSVESTPGAGTTLTLHIPTSIEVDRSADEPVSSDVEGRSLSEVER